MSKSVSVSVTTDLQNADKQLERIKDLTDGRLDKYHVHSKKSVFSDTTEIVFTKKTRGTRIKESLFDTFAPATSRLKKEQQREAAYQTIANLGIKADPLNHPRAGSNYRETAAYVLKPSSEKKAEIRAPKAQNDAQKTASPPVTQKPEEHSRPETKFAPPLPKDEEPAPQKSSLEDALRAQKDTKEKNEALFAQLDQDLKEAGIPTFDWGDSPLQGEPPRNPPSTNHLAEDLGNLNLDSDDDD